MSVITGDWRMARSSLTKVFSHSKYLRGRTNSSPVKSSREHSTCMCMYMYVYMHTCVCVCVHVYVVNATALNIHDRLSLSLSLSLFF